VSNFPSFEAIMGQAIGGTLPSPPIADGMVAELVRRALVAEPAFAHCWIRLRPQGEREAARNPVTVNGEIAIRVVDGTIILHGEVACLGQKRLAGALAWWVPGGRTVVNALRVTRPEDDGDAEITDCVRLVLKKDPFLNSAHVQVSTNHAKVTLDGMVPSKLAREIAEHDAWYVYGVEEVVNRITIG